MKNRLHVLFDRLDHLDDRNRAWPKEDARIGYGRLMISDW